MTSPRIQERAAFLWASTRQVVRETTPAAPLLAGMLALDVSSWLANLRFPASGAAAGALAVARLVALTLAFGCFALCALRERPAWVHRAAPILIWPLLLWSIWTAAQGLRVVAEVWPQRLTGPAIYGSDAVYDQHYNAWLMLHGQNPYTGERLTGVSSYFHIIAYTPLARGVFADPRRLPTPHELHLVYNAFTHDPAHPPVEIDPRVTHSYPAGSFLLVAPFVWAGASSVAGAFIVACVALWLALIACAPGRWRWLAALGPLLMVDGLRQVAGGDFEILALALVLGAWLARERRLLSIALLGVAVATKQTAWMATPFYLLWVWRAHGRDEALRRGAGVAGVFLVVNAPWIVLSPGAWLASLPLPFSLPLLPNGVGVIGLAAVGLGGFAPPAMYAALELLAFGGLLRLAWLLGERAPFLGCVVPLAPLLLAWRSPERYFELIPLAALAAFLLTRQLVEASASPTAGRGSSHHFAARLTRSAGPDRMRNAASRSA
ncbi:MAG TPA: hypothetical protein VF812_05180 [Ktedonobacterales bacterium]